jgi:hypothetical protein
MESPMTINLELMLLELVTEFLISGDDPPGSPMMLVYHVDRCFRHETRTAALWLAC